MKTIRQTKQLQSQLNLMLADEQVLSIEIKNKQQERNQKLQAIEKLRKQIKELESSDNPRVSEHAILRYFERVKGYDIEAIEKEILSEDVLKMVEKLGGNGSYPNKDFSVKMCNYTVTTIIKK